MVRLGKKYVRVSLADLEVWVDQQTSLERRIDREPSDFHSAFTLKKRHARIFKGGGAQARGGGSKNNERASSKSQPKTSVGFRTPVSTPNVAEPGAVEAETSRKEG